MGGQYDKEADILLNKTVMLSEVSCFPLATVSNFTHSVISLEPKNQAGRIIFSINNKICRIKVPKTI